jgi:hypothetical protein
VAMPSESTDFEYTKSNGRRVTGRGGDQRMTDPMMFSMEALLAEDGQCVRAGLPESLRRELDETRRRAKERLERLDRLIAEYEACLAEVQRRLAELRREHAEATSATPAA